MIKINIEYKYLLEVLNRIDAYLLFKCERTPLSSIPKTSQMEQNSRMRIESGKSQCTQYTR